MGEVYELPGISRQPNCVVRETTMKDWLRVWAGHLFLSLIALDHLLDRLKPLWDKLRPIERFIERRLHQRRKPDMHIIESFLKFVEDLFHKHAPEIVAAANSPEVKAIEQAAASAAIQQASQDPKVAAGIAVYQAVRNYNEDANAQAKAPTL